MVKRDETEGQNVAMTADSAALSQLLDDLESSLLDLKKSPTDDSVQCEVCLQTRSAFTEFYSVSELAGETNPVVVKRLQKSFAAALKLLPGESSYRKSVEGRFQDFERYCSDLESRCELDTEVSL